MDGVYLTIENRKSLVQFLQGMVNNGYLKRLNLKEVNDWIWTIEFPIRFPVDVNGILGVSKNQVVKGVFGKTIDKGLTDYLMKSVKAGC